MSNDKKKGLSGPISFFTNQNGRCGMNRVLIDWGDGVKYDSLPEIAVNGAWSTSQLKKELKTIRKLGLEPIPKLNFSTGHKAWLGPYQRMISSDTYYKVCTKHEKYVRIYDRLEEHGFDQVPTGSNHSNDINFRETVTYCEKKIAPERLKGFMQTVWRPTLPACQQKHIDAIDQVAEVIRNRS